VARSIQLDEILDLGDYERARPERRSRAMAARALRRVAVGPSCTFSFENHETLLYQVHEMLRAERIVQEGQIAHEVETYNELLPGPAEPSATMMLEFPDAAERPRRLAELVGLERCVALVIGDTRAPARFDERQLDPDRVSAVQFLRFPLGKDALAGLSEGKTVRLSIDHPHYTHSAELGPETIAAIRDDLREASS